MLSAEKSKWYGGVKGVRGEHYKIVLSVSERFRSSSWRLRAGEVEVPLKVIRTEEGNGMFWLEGTYSYSAVRHYSKDGGTNPLPMRYELLYEDSSGVNYKVEMPPFKTTESTVYP